MSTTAPEPIDVPTPPGIDHPPRIVPTPPPIVLPKFDLPDTDNIPMETPWHRSAMNLLIGAIHWHRRGRPNYYVGGNMFIYYGARQARTWSYRGPDFFFVDEIEDPDRERRTWIVWEEEGRYPDVIIELTSRSTAEEDHGIKKQIYERTFRTPTYFCYDPDTRRLEGWHLVNQHYHNLQPNERGWLWCEELGLWLGTWEGYFQGQRALWPRFYDALGNLVMTEAEYRAIEADQERQRADQERQRADQERQRADQAAAQLARLQAWLEQQKLGPPGNGGQVQ